MIAYLEGKFTVKTPTYVIIECGGIGYQIHISLNTYTKIQQQSSGKLFCHHILKEDGHTTYTPVLYGFADELEKYLFVNLVSVSGIGPNTGRMMLSSLSPKELHEAIVGENVTLIKTIKGIGPKSAQRLVLELKDKLDLSKFGYEESVETVKVSATNNTLMQETLSALASLGIAKPMAQKAINRGLKSSPDANSVEELVKLALKNM